MWGGLQGDQADFHLSLPGWLHTQCLPPPVTTCDSTHQAFPPARLTQACVQSFRGGLGMKGSPSKGQAAIAGAQGPQVNRGLLSGTGGEVNPFLHTNSLFGLSSSSTG